MKEYEKRNSIVLLVPLVLLFMMLTLFVPSVEEGELVDIEDLNGDSIESFAYIEGYSTFQPDPTPFTLFQPDDTEFTGKKIGERVGGRVETLDGYSLVQDEEGWWTYADKGITGKLVPTEHRVGKINPESIVGLIPHLSNDPPEFRKMEDEDLPHSTRAPPLNQTWKAIAIMLNFTDMNFDPGRNQAYYSNLLNGTTGNTMRNYYREVSYGQFDIEIDVVGPFPSVHYMAWYGADDHGLDTGDGATPRNIFEMAREAVQLADPTVDFSRYDGDSDGTIDAIFIIHAGSGQEGAGGTNSIWSHKSNIFPGESVDGVTARTYSTEPDEGKIGVFAHEFGHVLGLPDLYDRDYSSWGIGNWGLMAGGSWNGGGNSPAHLSAWSKIQLGWIEPKIVTSDLSNSTLKILPVQRYPVVYKMWAHDPQVNTDEYFLIANRQKMGYDSALPGEGILIWHIDDSIITQNDDENHYLVDLEEAHGGTQHLQAKSNKGDANDPWVGLARNFTATSDPASTSYNGSSTDVWVWNISTILPDDNMTIGFNEITTGPTGIIITAPVSNTTILPVQDFVMNDNLFPDEDVNTAPGSLILEYSPASMDLWWFMPSQTLINWTAGWGGVINCSSIPNGTWDFRVNVTDEEGHQMYTPVVVNIKILDLAPPIADAGPDNITGTDWPLVLDGSNSSDDSGYIAWYNWSFGDGNYLNGSGPAYAKIIHYYTYPGNYTVTLNISDAQGNKDEDTLNITAFDASPPITNLTISDPKYRVNLTHNWNITGATPFNLSAYDLFTSVNFSWYMIDSDYFEFQGLPFDLSAYSEGSHVITYGSEDAIGNNDTGIQVTVWIDESDPITSLSIDWLRYPKIQNDGCNVTSATNFSLSAYDEPVVHNSSLNFTWYTIDGDYYIGTSFNLSGYGDGSHVINWGSQDMMFNNETGNSITLWVDDSPPKTNLSIGFPRHPLGVDEGSNVTSYTLFTLLDFDQPASHNAGINFSWYIIDGDYYEGTSFNLSGYGIGSHNISWGSEDNLFNNETGNNITVWLDDIEPQTILVIGDPQHPKVENDGSNVTSNAPFVLTPQDYPAHDSGVAFTWYKIDSDYYEGTLFNLTGYSEGPHIISWGSQDNVENNETNTITVWLDDTMPHTILIIGPEKFPTSGFDGCNVTANTQFTLVPEDYPEHNSSIKLSWFTIDGEYYEGVVFQLADFGLNEGLYTITWGSIDNLDINETGNSIIVYLDKLAPKTNAEIGEPRFRDYSFNFWNITKETVITLNSSDGYSGVALSWYIIEGEYFEGESFTLSGFDDGTYTIFYGSLDNLGYNESQNSVTIVLDTKPPSSYLDVAEPKYRLNPSDYWNITTSTVFNLFSNDENSGVEIDWYIIDSVYFEGAVFNLLGYSEGIHTITWGAKDRLGNNQTINTTFVCVDTSPPLTDIIVLDPKHRTNETHPWNVTSTTSFELQAIDDYSGVDFIWFEIDGDYFKGSLFNLSGYSEGFHIIAIGSVDMVGNNETGSLITIRLDDSPPQTAIDIGAPKHRKNGNDLWNVTWETAFTLEPLDFASDIKTIWYMINGLFIEGQQFNLSGYANGIYNITWGSMDNLNHNETPNYMLVQLDTIPPSTNLSLEGPMYRSNIEDDWNVTQSTHFTFTSLDEYSDVDFIWYTIDGEYFEDKDFLLISYPDGLYYITYGAQDVMGNNESAASLRVYIDTTFPETTITIGNVTPPMDERFSMNTSSSVTLSANDGQGVGIDYIWYSLDGGSTYNLYESPFTAPLSTNTIMFGARDHIGNNASSTVLLVDVDEFEIDDDFDDDGVKNEVDEFPYDPTEWVDTDGDGIGDNADLDDDNDGHLDINDAFPVNDTEWLDTDNDTIGDNTDLDDDNDEHPDTDDAFPLDPSEWQDNDNDNIGDNEDPDDDNDNHMDSEDAFPLDPTEWKDKDGDGIGDNEDKDDDGDGLDDDSVPAMMKNNALILILIFVIIAILLVLLIIMRGRKGEKESVTFQKGETPVRTPAEVQPEEVEVMVLEEEKDNPDQIKWQ
jgi:immune inhibitor A